jgi:uncharacterized membrane protein
MIYAFLKTLHVLSIVAWVGGMFFVLACLRPALVALAPPQRLALMVTVMERFFVVVLFAVAIVLASGIAMLWIDMVQAPGFRMPKAWSAMAGLGIVMMLIFGHLRFALLPRLQAAVAASDSVAASAALAAIRVRVVINLALGVLIVAVMLIGPAI